MDGGRPAGNTAGGTLKGSSERALRGGAGVELCFVELRQERTAWGNEVNRRLCCHSRPSCSEVTVRGQVKGSWTTNHPFNQVKGITTFWGSWRPWGGKPGSEGDSVKVSQER